MHWLFKKGSGVERSFCFKCNAVTCGKPLCIDRCVPMEKMIEGIEAAARMDANMAVLRRS